VGVRVHTVDQRPIHIQEHSLDCHVVTIPSRVRDGRMHDPLPRIGVAVDRAPSGAYP
jgi:hypothetical protein